MDTATMSSTPTKPSQSQQILPMIERRILNEVEPVAEKAMRDLERVVCGELEKMGIQWQRTNLTQFSEAIRKKYASRLMDERIKAIVDSLMSEKPVVMGVDIASGPDASIITVTMPPNLTQAQRDAIIANLKAQLPADTQVVSLVGGAQLGRV